MKSQFNEDLASIYHMYVFITEKMLCSELYLHYFFKQFFQMHFSCNEHLNTF